MIVYYAAPVLSKETEVINICMENAGHFNCLHSFFYKDLTESTMKILRGKNESK